MDTAWFRQQLAARKITQRTLAKNLDLDHAAVSLMLRGKRRMQPNEAQQLADTLGVKTTEILRRAGINVIDDVRTVMISAWVDDKGTVTLFPAKTHDRVVGPADCPSGTFGIQCRVPGAPQDGWLLYVSPAQEEPLNNLDKLCLVATAQGAGCVALLRRGYRTGTYNLMAWPKYATINDATVAWCSPVLWIKP